VVVEIAEDDRATRVDQRRVTVQELTRRQVEPFAGGAATSALEDQLESPLEAEFLDFLRAGGYRLPERSQVYFEAAGTRPDFVYDDACAVIYVDGPHHDYADRQARDRAQDEAMRALGYRVIRFGHRDDWPQKVDAFRSVFGPGGE
jgi:very-short-patch-repair endonuclease